jgi:Ca2+-dependent lipid-binding protein
VIEVVGAKGLAAADSSMFSKPTSDPYCTIKDVKGLRGSSQHTKVCKKTLTPTWNATCRSGLLTRGVRWPSGPLGLSMP